jgi:hypothetical protein
MGLGRPVNNPVAHAAALWAINWVFRAGTAGYSFADGPTLGVMDVSYDRHI